MKNQIKIILARKRGYLGNSPDTYEIVSISNAISVPFLGGVTATPGDVISAEQAQALVDSGNYEVVTVQHKTLNR